MLAGEAVVDRGGGPQETAAAAAGDRAAPADDGVAEVAHDGDDGAVAGLPSVDDGVTHASRKLAEDAAGPQPQLTAGIFGGGPGKVGPGCGGLHDQLGAVSRTTRSRTAPDRPSWLSSGSRRITRSRMEPGMALIATPWVPRPRAG